MISASCVSAFRMPLAALALVAAATTSVSAQTNTFTAGTLLDVPALSAVPTTGALMGGMRVTWTFVGIGPVSSNWADLGGGSWGVSSDGFRIAVGAGSNTFAAVWSLTNATNNRVSSVQFDGAPGLTVFDCGSGIGCTQDTPGSNQGRSLFTAGGTYGGSVTGVYTNRVGVAGNPSVGDLYEQLTVTFDDILGAQSTYTFIADTDSFLQPPAVPEPHTWALMLAGLAAIGVVSRRRR